ncbi:MAG: hypothetical protein PHO92_05300 [Candidatus Peribacteraceae bacterium]|nr:hypothetical protein [Candidatus Peribacteraceae bacterium]
MKQFACMTKPRTAPARELFGLLGRVPDASGVQAEWNRFFAARGMDAFMGKYPAKPEQLPERLSEMFHFDRRLYLIGADLQEAVVALLDASDSARADIVFNRGGVLRGMFLGTTDLCAVLSACGVLLE